MKGKPYRGIVYSVLNENGEKAGNPFKSSLFGKSVGMEALENRIVKSAEIIKRKGLKERPKKVISAAMRMTNNRSDFEKALEEQGISVLFRTNDEGRIYGVTFIDHEQKCVFNGSRLGKEFSANIFNDLFNGNGRTHEQQEERTAGRSFESFTPSNREGEERTAGQSFEPFTPSNREREEGSGIGGLFDLLTPETAGDEIEEENFNRRLKKKQKRQRRI